MADANVPIGGIIPWYRPSDKFNIPEGFVPCDGKQIIAGPYKGSNTPDLRDRFLRGANDTAPLTTGGGTDVNLSKTFRSKTPKLAAGTKKPKKTNVLDGATAIYNHDKWFATPIHGHDTAVSFKIENKEMHPAWVGLMLIMRVE